MGIFGKEKKDNSLSYKNMDNMKYIVITASAKIKFIEQVNEKIEIGYICQGGVSDTDRGFCQAMIKNS